MESGLFIKKEEKRKKLSNSKIHRDPRKIKEQSKRLLGIYIMK